MTNVFVYGTLKQGFGNHRVLGNSKFLAAGRTVETSFVMYNGGFPFVSDKIVSTDHQGSVVGELYEVGDEQTMANLDRLEGVPTLYIQREVDVETGDGEVHKAIMYVASDRSNHSLQSNSHRPIMTPINNQLEWSY